jgi:uncharacterized membrane protein YphA (DoxX/SURF4 family)
MLAREGMTLVPPRAGPLARALGSLQEWVLAHGITVVRLLIGVVYFWFGALKFDPVVSAAEVYLPGRVISVLTFGGLSIEEGTRVLAFWECLIGFCLVSALAVRMASLLLLAHLLVMFLPVALWPGQVWISFPFVLTIKGQIIIDNLVLIACAMVLASAVPRRSGRPRGGRLGAWYRAWHEGTAHWMGRNGILFLRIALGVLFLWFGAIKFLAHTTPFEAFALKTAEGMSGGLIPSKVALILLAMLECLIGLGLLAGRAPRIVLLLIVLHLCGTIAPLFLEPDRIWIRFPFLLTLPGKYIFRHLALYSAAIVIAASVAQRARGWSSQVNPFLDQEPPTRPWK